MEGITTFGEGKTHFIEGPLNFLVVRKETEVKREKGEYTQFVIFHPVS